MLFTLLAAALAQTPPADPADDAPPLDVTPGVFFHIRPEVRVNPTFDSSVADRQIVVHQNAQGRLHARRGLVAATVWLQGVTRWGLRGNSTSTAAEVYPHQGYLEIGDDDRWVRAGRQEIHMLNGFYVSAAPWNVAGRSFDALRGHWQDDTVSLDVMGVVETAPEPESAARAEPTLGDTFGAVFATFQASKDIEPSLWVIGRGGGPTADSPERRKLWIGPGGRFYATPGKTAFDLNGMANLGSDSGTPIVAYSVIARIDQGVGPIGMAVVFDQTSGHACQGDPAEGECATDVIRDFDLTFGRNHYLRGNADQVLGANARDLALEVNSTPVESLKAILQGHLFQLTNTQGRWRRVGDQVQGQGWLQGNDDPNLGVEVDAMLDWSPQKGVKIDGGYCFFQPIGAGAAIAGSDPMHYLFVRNRFTF